MSVISNFSVIPIHWLLQLLTVDSDMDFFSFSVLLLRIFLFSFKTHARLVGQRIFLKKKAKKMI